MIAISAIAGALVWIGLYICQTKKRPLSFRDLTTIVIIVGLTCRILFALFTPVFYAPDEQSHFNYVKYLYEHKQFPVQITKTEGTKNEWEYHQPPVYYVALVPAYWLLEKFFKNNTPIKVISFRLLSIMLWAFTVLLALRILQELGIKDLFIKTTAISVVCLLPTYTFLSSVINNDNLVITLGGIILLLLLKERTYPNSIALGLLLGMALLTKDSAVVYVFSIMALFFIHSIKKMMSYKSALTHLVIVLFIASLIWSPWAYRNLKLYGDVSAENAPTTLVQWSSMSEAIIYTQNYMKESFWAVSGIYNNVQFLPAVGIWITFIIIAGLLFGLFGKMHRDRLMSGYKGIYLAAMGFAITVNIFLLTRYGVLYGQGQGRHLYPMLIPIALIIPIGIELVGLPQYIKNMQIHAVGFFVTYAVCFTVYSFEAFSRL